MINIKIAILMIAFLGNIFLFGIAESNDHEVYQVQKKLKELGYDPGAIDGIWGKKTTSAIRRFQRDNGLHVTGQLDKQTREELIIKKLPSQRSFNEAVKLLIANGADVSAKNNEGMTAEQMAFQNGHQSIVNLLGQHINQ